MKYRYYIFFFISFFTSSVFAQTHKIQSVLASGQVYKIEIKETGVHRLTYEWLQEQLGINPADWNADNIQLFGNGGGQLPEANLADRVDDLEENAIQIVGGEDGQLNAGDYILFYAENQDKVYYDEEDEMWLTQKNVFDTKNFYFLKIGADKGKRIASQDNLTNATYVSNSFDDFIHFEEDKVNLLDEFDFAQGSGKRWYGDQFKNVKSYDYDFTFPDLVTTDEVKIKARLAARARQSRSFTIDVSGQMLQSNRIGSTSGSFNEPAESTYANIGTIESNFTAESDLIDLTVSYEGEEAWLDYITLNARRVLKLEEAQVRFSDAKSLEQAQSAFQLESSKEALIWEISNPMEVRNQVFAKSGNTYTFGYESESLKSFIAFAANETIEPNYIQPIDKQNLHNLQRADLIIVYPTEFELEAERLAEHRRSYSGLEVETVLIDRIFNEFSSGRQDPTAIRDFARMLHLRDAGFKYLLLFGDGSFDYRNIKNRGSNFVTVYETDRSEDPIDAFPSDDYFGLLDDEEGSSLRGDLDIAVGRLPIKTISEARQVVDKILRYDLNDNAMGDWRNRVAFAADDEDNNLHIKDTDFISRTFRNAQPKFNQEKIYFDAFEQQSTSGGQGFPGVTEALSQTLFKGVLAINYLGHGGSQGWAQERVLDKNRGDIKKLDNRDRLPVFVTATCSFAGYDDPNQVTGGEEVLLNPNGGGIALFTTVRAVYASSNAALVRSVFDTMFYLVDGKRPTLGHIMRTSKNASTVGRSTNSRKFTLLGDPSQPLALPKKRVTTTSISSDTLRAFQKVTITGQVENLDGTLANTFNGELTTSIFDKTIAYTTLAQDSGSKPFTFDLQKNVIFKGRASVVNGQFEITFVMPKDINFEFGQGRISYYAKDLAAMEDASGVYEEIVIGGA
ncbi:MAG: type IX secretion system sortase PorU, partial [Bacteroidota bacterium]